MMTQRSRSFKRVFGANLTNLPNGASSSSSSLKKVKPIAVTKKQATLTIYDYLKIKDTPKKDQDLFVQTTITRSMRRILVEWMINFTEKFRLAQETLFEAICFLDTVLSNKMNFKPQELQLIGVTCLWIASKYEEVYPPPVKHFVEMTDGAYTKKDLLRMEELIIKLLDFNLTRPTRYHLILTQLQHLQIPVKSLLHDMSLYLCELSTLDIWGCREQDISNGAIYLANRILRKSKLGIKQIQVCIEAKNVSLNLIKMMGHNTVSMKYDCQQRQYVGGYTVQKKQSS